MISHRHRHVFRGVIAPMSAVAIIVLFTASSPSVAAPGADTDSSDSTSLASAIRVLNEQINDAGNPFKVIAPPAGATIRRYGEAKFTVHLPQAGCYRILASGDAPGRDINLAVLVDEKTVAADRTSGELPAIDWCAPAAVDVTVHLSVYSSDSACAYAVLQRKPGVSAADLVVGGTDNDLIANRIRQLHSMKMPTGKVISALLRGNLATGGRQEFDLNLVKGTCVTVIAAAEPSLRRSQLTLLNPDGTVIVEKAGSGFALLEGGCAKQDGVHRLRITAQDGSGQFGIQAFTPVNK